MKWIIKTPLKPDRELDSLLLNPITLQLLLQRGFFSKEKIRKFLSVRYEDLHETDTLSGIREAVLRIGKAREQKEPITVFGDYDADGITSTVLLLETLSEIGISASSYIPDRNKEGYGLNKRAIDHLSKKYKTKLLITVDCGISNSQEIGYARDLGMEVIVIDHHSLPKKLPKESILINPKLENQKYPFKDLAGVGVTFKVCQAIFRKFLPEKIDRLKWFMDIVAIGTIADCVPLLDENRIFAKFGLIVLQKTKRLGIQEIIKTARLKINDKNPPSAENIAFQIGPRFNAAGRMDHANLTLSLLMEKDPVKARLSALELEDKNSQRQKITQEVYEEVKATLKEEENYRLIIRKGKNWPLGILGVVSGKIAEEYHCPVFILKESRSIYEGSGRSISGLNLMEAVEKTEDLLEKYGGHSQAMGIKVKKRNAGAFEKNLLEIMQKNYDENIWGKKLYIDAEVDPEKIDWDLISEIKKFEPFGEGNREPVFLVKDLRVREASAVGNGRKHLKFVFAPAKKDTKYFEGIFFGGGDQLTELPVSSEVSVVCNLRSNEWNGNHRIELNVIDARKKG